MCGKARWRRLAAVRAHRSARAGGPLGTAENRQRSRGSRTRLPAGRRATGRQQNARGQLRDGRCAGGVRPRRGPGGEVRPGPPRVPRPGRRKRSQGGSGPPPAGAARRKRGGAGLGWGSSTGHARSPRSLGPLSRAQVSHRGPAGVTQPNSLHRAGRERSLTSGPPANRRTTRVD